MMFNATFKNISAISWRSVLLVEETEDSEKTTDLSQVTNKLYHMMLYTLPWSRFELTTSVVIDPSYLNSSIFTSRHHYTKSRMKYNSCDRTSMSTERISFWWARDPFWWTPFISCGSSCMKFFFCFWELGFKVDNLKKRNEW